MTTDAEHSDVNAQCQSKRGEVRCLGRASVRLLVGCVHEHLREYDACPLHEAKAREEQMQCLVCRDRSGDRNHNNCRVRLLGGAPLPVETMEAG